MPTDKDRQLHILDSLRQMVLDDTIRNHGGGVVSGQGPKPGAGRG